MAGPSGALSACAVVETWYLVLLIHPAYYVRSRSGLPWTLAYAACRVSHSPSKLGEVLDPEAACLSGGLITYQQPPSQGGRQPTERTAGSIGWYIGGTPEIKSVVISGEGRPIGSSCA